MTDQLWGESPVNAKFTSQRASNAWFWCFLCWWFDIWGDLSLYFFLDNCPDHLLGSVVGSWDLCPRMRICLRMWREEETLPQWLRYGICMKTDHCELIHVPPRIWMLEILRTRTFLWMITTFYKCVLNIIYCILSWSVSIDLDNSFVLLCCLFGWFVMTYV